MRKYIMSAAIGALLAVVLVLTVVLIGRTRQEEIPSASQSENAVSERVSPATSEEPDGDSAEEKPVPVPTPEVMPTSTPTPTPLPSTTPKPTPTPTPAPTPTPTPVQARSQFNGKWISYFCDANGEPDRLDDGTLHYSYYEHIDVDGGWVYSSCVAGEYGFEHNFTSQKWPITVVDENTITYTTHTGYFITLHLQEDGTILEEGGSNWLKLEKFPERRIGKQSQYD